MGQVTNGAIRILCLRLLLNDYSSIGKRGMSDGIVKPQGLIFNCNINTVFVSLFEEGR